MRMILLVMPFERQLSMYDVRGEPCALVKVYASVTHWR
jgi:hypothetical protein